MEEWKIKVSVLWLVWIVSFVIHMMFLLFEPGGIEQISMQLTPELMLFAAILMLVPLVMAFLSLTLKDSINRLENVVLGIVYTSICLFDWIGSPVQPALHILMYLSHIVASALIVWYAWNSKKLA